jgi:hypothetical protein
MDSEQVNKQEETPIELNTEEINDHSAELDTSQPVSEVQTPDELAKMAAEEGSTDPIGYIKQMLESKSTAKQTTFKNISEAFSLMCTDSKRIIQELNSVVHPADEDVTLYFKSISKHEFQVKLAGDLLIFVMHTNIVTFDDEFELMKDPYIKENPVNRYFGQINIYNFMYDSLRYNRGNDSGYLIGRLMINHDNRYFMEGEHQFTKLYGKISNEPIHDTVLQNIVKHSLRIAIKNDLVAPPYSRVRSITLNQKNEHTIEMGGGQKIGYRMSYQNPLG